MMGGPTRTLSGLGRRDPRDWVPQGSARAPTSLGDGRRPVLASWQRGRGGEDSAGWPAVAHFVCVVVPLGTELGPRNVCAHHSRPARVGESVWEWSSTADVDVVDGMAWRQRLRGDVRLRLLYFHRGVVGGGWTSSRSMVAPRSGSGTV